MLRTVFYILIAFFSIEIVFLSFSGNTENAVILEIMKMTYFILLLLIYIVFTLILALFHMITLNFDQSIIDLSNVTQAFFLIFTIIFKETFETVIAIFIFPFKIFGDSAVNEIAKAISSVIIDKEIDVNYEVGKLYIETFGNYYNAGFELQISIGGSSGSVFAKKVRDAFRQQTAEEIDKINSALEALNVTKGG